MPHCKKNSNPSVNPSTPPLARSAQAAPEPPTRTLRRVLVTGGAHRLGAQICRQFAQAGWEVLVHYHQSEQAAQALAQQIQQEFGVRAHACAGNLADAGRRRAMIDGINTQYGAVHALVNNAAMFSPDTGRDFTDARAQAHWQVNLLVPLALARDLVLYMNEAHPTTVPCIVHVLDQKVFNLNPDYFSYTLSKLALERAVALQAQALAPHARVCGVAPGLMFLSGDQSLENFALASKANLLRQPIDPADVAKACVFMAETQGITGTTLVVDNGQHLVPTPRDIMFVTEDLLQQRHPPQGAAP